MEEVLMGDLIGKQRARKEERAMRYGKRGMTCEGRDLQSEAKGWRRWGRDCEWGHSENWGRMWEERKCNGA